MSPEFSNVLIRGASWMGDSIITIPALHELRRIFPSARFTMMVKPWLRDIFSGTGILDDIITYDRKANGGLAGIPRMTRTLRSRGFDTAILFQNAFEAAVLPFLARIPTRIGYSTEARGPLLTHPVKLAKETLAVHQIYYYLRLASQIEETFLGRSHVDFLRPHYKLEIEKKEQDAAAAFLDRIGIDRKRRLIAINPGATNSRAKRWLPERFAALADRLIARENCTVLLIGAKSDTDVADSVARQMSLTPVHLTGRTSVAELIGILSLCDLVVSNDTGPAYVAGALCRPTLTIFGPTNLQSTCPTSPTSHVLTASVHCSPCMLRDCPTQHECMVGVTVDRVYERAVELLGERKGNLSNSQFPILIRSDEN